MNIVTIVVPIYNTELYIAKCLDSICSQTYKNIQIVCVDDGSTDNSLDILKEYDVRDDRIYLIQQENSGVSSARNTGIKNAQGDYILFVDADDWLEEDCIEKVLHFSIENDLDICAFPYISEHGSVHLKRELFPNCIVMDERETSQMARRIIGPIGRELKNPLMLDSYGTIWGKLYKRSVIEGLEFVDLKIIGSAEDSFFNMHAYRKAKRTGYFNTTFYHYRTTNVNSETSQYRPWLKDRWKTQYDMIANDFIGQDERIALRNRIAINTYGLTANLRHSENPIKCISDVLHDPVFSNAVQQLNTSPMAFIWKVFFEMVKHNCVLGIVLFHFLIALARRLLR